MYTQNTPVHIRLWHRGFWLLAMANLLLSASVYMLLPVLPLWLMGQGATPVQTGLIMGAYGLGLFLLGGFCSYLVQTYRRNRVCIWAIIAMAASIAGLLLSDGLSPDGRQWATLGLRLALGATFALADMVLASTLIIDQCESAQRTEANYASSWFRRLSIAIGPLAGLFLMRLSGPDTVFIVAAGLTLLAALLVRCVHFPFKAPEEDVRLLSLDRFLLPQGGRLFANLLVFAAVTGLLISMKPAEMFFLMLMAGFLLALLAQKFVFVNAELKSETVAGLIAVGAAIALSLSAQTHASSLISPVFIGFGVGTIGSRFLLFFIKLSGHCQRGTSQSTFFLCWELGISVGVLMRHALFWGEERQALVTSLALTALALAMYLTLTHPWYMKNKNR